MPLERFATSRWIVLARVDSSHAFCAAWLLPWSAARRVGRPLAAAYSRLSANRYGEPLTGCTSAKWMRHSRWRLAFFMQLWPSRQSHLFLNGRKSTRAVGQRILRLYRSYTLPSRCHSRQRAQMPLRWWLARRASGVLDHDDFFSSCRSLIAWLSQLLSTWTA